MSRRAAILAALALFAATAAHAAAERSQVPAAPDPDGTIASGWTLSGDSAPGLTVGETTPSFSYLGIDGEYRLLPGAVHGMALRAHWGRPLPLPRAGAWARCVARELERFEGSRSISAP